MSFDLSVGVVEGFMAGAGEPLFSGNSTSFLIFLASLGLEILANLFRPFNPSLRIPRRTGRNRAADICPNRFLIKQTSRPGSFRKRDLKLVHGQHAKRLNLRGKEPPEIEFSITEDADLNPDKFDMFGVGAMAFQVLAGDGLVPAAREDKDFAYEYLLACEDVCPNGSPPHGLRVPGNGRKNKIPSWRLHGGPTSTSDGQSGGADVRGFIPGLTPPLKDWLTGLLCCDNSSRSDGRGALQDLDALLEPYVLETDPAFLDLSKALKDSVKKTLVVRSADIYQYNQNALDNEYKNQSCYPSMYKSVIQALIQEEEKREKERLLMEKSLLGQETSKDVMKDESDGSPEDDPLFDPLMFDPLFDPLFDKKKNKMRKGRKRSRWWCVDMSSSFCGGRS